MNMPAIDPVALSIGPLQLRWYGLMYLFAFAGGWLLARWRASRPGSGWNARDVDDLLTFVMLGVILGARLGYVLFYDLPAYVQDPLEVLRLWNGGMSFHGGLLGVVAALGPTSTMQTLPCASIWEKALSIAVSSLLAAPCGQGPDRG